MKKAFLNLKKLYSYTKEFKKNIIIYIVCVPFLSAISIIVPLFTAKQLIYINDALYKELFYAALIILSFELTRNFINYVGETNLNLYFRKTMKELKLKALKAVFNIKNKNLDETPSGVIIERVNSDCNRMSDIIPQIVFSLLSIITNLGVIVTIFFINKIIFLYLLAGSIIVFIFNDIRIKKWYKFDKQRRKENEKVTSFIAELIRGVRDIKVLNANNSFLGEAENRIDKQNKTLFEGRQVLRKYDLITNSIRDMLNFGFIILGIILLKAGLVTIAGFIATYMYRERIYNMFAYYTNLQEAMQNFELSSKRVYEIIDGNSYERESFGNKVLKNAEGNLEFKHVKFEYKKKQPVLKDISFKVDANTTVAFVGKSGTGKTTIFNLVSKLYEAQSGNIYLDGIDINDLDEDSIRGNMTIINQSPYIFNMSIYDNMKLVCPKATKKDIIKACKIACLDDFINTLPKKYKTVVGEGGISLSGGQRQRLAIARALLQKTPIILFDEATSALDNETQKSIQDAINNMKGNYTILIIAHRFSTVLNSDKIIFIENGKIKAEGTHKELLKKSKSYKNLYELELKKN